MDTLQLKYFLSLAQSLNFTSVAKQHYITQPAVTHQIKKLEESLGVRLFERSNRKVTLTQAGEDFYQYATEIFDLAEKAEARMKKEYEGQSPFLRISVVPALLDDFTSYVSAFRKKNPDVIVEIEYHCGFQQITAIDKGRCDFYFSFESLFLSTGIPSVLRLSCDKFCIFIREDLAKGINPNDFSTLPKLPLITESRAAAPFMYDKVLAICAKERYSPNSIQSYPSAGAVQVAVSAGLGFCLLPEHNLSVYPSGVIALPINGKFTRIEYAVAWDSRNDNPTKAQFIAFLKQGLAGGGKGR
jgi:DNA-binding transcriptional LysR family regulator